MSEKEKNPIENSESKDSLDFQDAKEMTIGEAVRKDSEIKAGVTAVSYTHLTLPTIA